MSGKIISIYNIKGYIASHIQIRNVIRDLDYFSIIDLDSTIFINNTDESNITFIQQVIEEGYKNAVSCLTTSSQQHSQNSIRMKIKYHPIVSKRYLLADGFAEISTDWMCMLNSQAYTLSPKHQLNIELQFVIYK